MKGEVDRNDHRCLIGRHTEPSDSAVLGRYGQQSDALGRGNHGRTPGIYPHVATMTPIRWWRQGLLTLNNSSDPADRRRREASPSLCGLTRGESWTFGAVGNHLAPREWPRARNLETETDQEDTSPARCGRGSSHLSCLAETGFGFVQPSSRSRELPGGENGECRHLDRQRWGTGAESLSPENSLLGHLAWTLWSRRVQVAMTRWRCRINSCR